MPAPVSPAGGAGGRGSAPGAAYGFAGLFWCTSIFLTMYNKWLFTVFGFHFPATLVTGTFALQSLMARAFVDPAALAVPRGLYLRAIVPIALAMAGEIAASNLSLLTLSVSFHTQVKACTPLAVLVASLALGLQRFRASVLGILVLVSAGIALCAYGEVRFALSGFLLILLAVALGGVRWALSQWLLQRLPGEAGAMALLAKLLPLCAASLAPFAALTELRGVQAYFAAGGGSPLLVAALIAVCAAVAFALIFVELRLIELTSSVTLSVLAICKELLLVAAAVAIYGDDLTPLNAVGFTIALLGVGLYRFHLVAQQGGSADADVKYERVATSETTVAL